MWEVDVTLVEPWLLGLDKDSYDLVVAALELPQERGPQLGGPLADGVKASLHKNMKELRPGSKGTSELRILYAFDVRRSEILLVAGDKSGKWKQWYKENVPLADDLYEEHLRQLKGEK